MLRSTSKLTLVSPLICMALSISVMAQNPAIGPDPAGTKVSSETKQTGSESKVGSAAKAADQVKVVKTAAEEEKTDEQRVKEQLPFYPLSICAICESKLEEAGDVKNHLHDGRLVRTCLATANSPSVETCSGTCSTTKRSRGVAAKTSGSFGKSGGATPTTTAPVC